MIELILIGLLAIASIFMWSQVEKLDNKINRLLNRVCDLEKFNETFEDDGK